MAASILNSERERELLSQAILDTLDSWPQLNRQIFTEAHYHGRSIESISGSLGMGMEAVRLILQDCDRRLRAALRAFRQETPVSIPLASTYAANRCFQ